MASGASATAWNSLSTTRADWVTASRVAVTASGDEPVTSTVIIGCAWATVDSNVDVSPGAMPSRSRNEELLMFFASTAAASFGPPEPAYGLSRVGVSTASASLGSAWLGRITMEVDAVYWDSTC